MQLIMDILSRAYLAFGLTINLTRHQSARFMFNPTSRLKVIDLESRIVLFILEVHSVEMAVFDAEISRRIAKTSTAFGKLEKRVWSYRGITTNTKLNVYVAFVRTVLLY